MSDENALAIRPSEPGEPPLELMRAAVDVGREVGKVLMADLPLGRWRGEGVEAKSDRELVSRVDLAAEKLIRKRLAELYPSHVVLGEEGGEEPSAGAPYRWIVDPVDGTTNYLHGHPLFGVSLACQRVVDEAIVAACVTLPYVDETFCAAKGHGAFLNSESIRLQASDCDDLADALVATGFAYDRVEHPNYETFVRVAKVARGIRRCGSAAADMAYVAAGRYDAYWERGIKPWDVAAGVLLVEEAGGTVTSYADGAGWDRDGRILACAPGLVEPLQAILT